MILKPQEKTGLKVRNGTVLITGFPSRFEQKVRNIPVPLFPG